MPEALLLDTSAILAFIEDEPGAEQVQSALLDVDAGGNVVYGCFVSLTEVEYITRQERGPAIAEQRMRDIRNLPIAWVHSDDLLCAAAAKLKANHRISFADAFVAAAAIRFAGSQRPRVRGPIANTEATGIAVQTVTETE